MIKLKGEKLQQYELGRIVYVAPKHGRTLQKVRFWKSVADNPLTVSIGEEDGTATAEIPNILLMDFGILTAEMVMVDENGNYEIEKANFDIRKRKKPTDYVFVNNVTYSEGGVSSWNDLTDKPFYEESVNAPLEITWDGNTDGLVTAGDMFYKVSDLTPSDGELASGSITYVTEDGTAEGSIEEVGGVVKISDDCTVIAEMVMIIRTSNVLISELGITFPEPGVYFLTVEGAYVSSLSLPSCTQTIIKKLPNEFLDLEWLPTKTKGYTEIIPETTFEFTTGGSQEHKAIDFVPETGAEYIVVWDGTEYTVTAQSMTVVDVSMVYIGNLSIGDGEPNTGEPFLIMYSTDTGCLVGTSTAGSHTFSLKTEGGYEYNKLPQEFAPEIPYFDLVEMGLPTITAGQDEVSVECDTVAIRNAIEKGAIKVRYNFYLDVDTPVCSIVNGTYVDVKDIVAYSCAIVNYLNGLGILLSLIFGDGIITAKAMILSFETV